MSDDKKDSRIVLRNLALALFILLPISHAADGFRGLELVQISIVSWVMIVLIGVIPLVFTYVDELIAIIITMCYVAIMFMLYNFIF